LRAGILPTYLPTFQLTSRIRHPMLNDQPPRWTNHEALLSFISRRTRTEIDSISPSAAAYRIFFSKYKNICAQIEIVAALNSSTNLSFRGRKTGGISSIRSPGWHGIGFRSSAQRKACIRVGFIDSSLVSSPGEQSLCHMVTTHPYSLALRIFRHSNSGLYIPVVGSSWLRDGISIWLAWPVRAVDWCMSLLLIMGIQTPCISKHLI